MNKFDDELMVENLKRLHDELDEAGKDGGGTFDLDLLFVDVLSACGLGELHQLERVVGKAGVVRALKMGCLPKVRGHG